MREDWNNLSRQSLRHAQGLVWRRKWRGYWGGVLPGGYDPESIVNEAVAELFNGKCRLGANYTSEELRSELMRLVYNQVHRYERRKEPRLLRNEVDLTPAALREQGASILDAAPWTGEAPHDQAIRHEAQARFRRFVNEFTAFLGVEDDLGQLFLALCQGHEKREELATRLEIDVAAVTNTRKRLDRRLDEFGAMHPAWPKVFIDQMKRL